MVSRLSRTKVHESRGISFDWSDPQRGQTSLRSDKKSARYPLLQICQQSIGRTGAPADTLRSRSKCWSRGSLALEALTPLSVYISAKVTVTGKLADTPTRGLVNLQLVDNAAIRKRDRVPLVKLID